MDKEIRTDKLLSITKMKAKNFKDDFIQDVLNLDDETYANLMEEYLDREDPFRKAKEKFAEYYAKEMGLKTEMGKDSATLLMHMFFEHQGIEKTKNTFIKLYDKHKAVFDIKDFSELQGVAEWKIQEWIDELEEGNEG